MRRWDCGGELDTGAIMKPSLLFWNEVLYPMSKLILAEMSEERNESREDSMRGEIKCLD